MSTTFANSINNNLIYADRAEHDAAGNDLQTTYATKAELPEFSQAEQDAMDSGINSTKVGNYDSHLADTTIHVTSADKTAWNAKEDAANKKQSIDSTSTTEFPSSKATADFVNSSVATATANFLGNYTLTDLGLTYPATDAQIETALDGYTFSPSPTNNDYVYVEIQNPQTTGIDDSVERFKFNGTQWLYEYTLNNSSFTSAEKAAIDSGITSSDVSAYNAHVADTDIHVTTSDKSTWNGKQDAINDLSTIRSGAQAGSTAVQPGDLATVAVSGDYDDLLNKPVIPTVPVQDVTVDGTSVLNAQGVAEITMPTIPVTDVEVDGSSVVNASGVAEITMPTIPVTDVEVDGTSVLNAQGVAEITMPTFTQAQADWTEADTTDPSYIQNKPTLAAVAVSGAYSDLSGTPTINNVPAVTSSDNNKVLKASYSGGTGSYSWQTESGGGGGGSYTAGTGIDITNDVISVDTSVVATQTDLADKEDAFTVGTGLEMDTTGGVNTLQVETPMDIVAGPGIAIDNPDSDTLRVSVGTSFTQAQLDYLKAALGLDETVLYSGLKSVGDDGSATYQLSESPLNFQLIKLYCCASDNSFNSSSATGNQGVLIVEWDTTVYLPYNTFIPQLMNGGAGTNFTQYWTAANISGIRTTTWTVQGSLNSATSNSRWFHIYKIVGVHRIANN